MSLTDAQVGAIGEQLFCAYALSTSDGELEAFRPVVDEDHVDVALRRKDDPGWVAFVQVKATVTRRDRFEARTTYPADAVRQDPAFLYALLQLDGPAILRCWLVPSADFNRLATRGRSGERRVQLVAWVRTDREDVWTPFQVAPDEIGERLTGLVRGLPAGREPSSLAAVRLSADAPAAEAGGGEPDGEWDEAAVRRLSQAVRNGAAEAVVAEIAGREPEPVLQLGGTGLLIALTAGVPGAPELARRFAEELRARDWDGDEDLAADLAGQPDPDLEAAPVDLLDLADFREGDRGLYGGAWIDLQTGEVQPAPADPVDSSFDEEAREAREEEPERWLWAENEGSRQGYLDMVEFSQTVPDSRLRGRLERALHGRGVFGRFRAEVSDHPSLVERWRRFSEERQLGRARAWLAGEGYRALPAPGKP